MKSREEKNAAKKALSLHFFFKKKKGGEQGVQCRSAREEPKVFPRLKKCIFSSKYSFFQKRPLSPYLVPLRRGDQKISPHFY